MTRVIGIDPGTVSVDLCGLDDGVVWLDRSIPTAEALSDPAEFIGQLRQGGEVELIVGPAGYGLPLIRLAQATEEDLRLAYLATGEESGGIGGLHRLARALAGSGLPIVYSPGVVHLPTVPPHRKLNRVDLGTADKVAAAALGIFLQSRRRGSSLEEVSFLLLELGGAFTAALAIEGGQIVDGQGGTSGPLGWRSSGGWDGEVAYLAGTVTKEMLFRGGAEDAGDSGTAAYVESIHKAALALTASVPAPREILLSGRRSRDPELRALLRRRLGSIAPVESLNGFARVAKEGAQGAAVIADGLAGGRHRELVARMRLTEARGTALDYLQVISRADARRRLGLA